MFVTHLSCTECQTRHDGQRPQGLCSSCAAPLEVVYDLATVAARCGRDEIVARRPAGMWRWRELLPVTSAAHVVTLGEGDTPLLELPRLGAELSIPRLFLKDEALNPTGSFKARGMSVAVSMAKAFGAKVLAAPSAGNAGGALAAYGARAGLRVVLALPDDTPFANQLEAEMCGAEVHLVPGTIADCGRWIADRSKAEGWTDLSTLKEPYRVEGKKTMGFELAEQLSWQLPDVILYPTGGGTGLVAMAKAFTELRTLGWLPPSATAPRFYAVQARGCAPIVEAWKAGAARAIVPPEPTTVASGLRVPAPVGDRWMLRTLRDSRGGAIAVEDSALLDGCRRLAATEGIFAGPEVGALVAALGELLGTGAIDPGERVVLFDTGTGLKYVECFRRDGR